MAFALITQEQLDTALETASPKPSQDWLGEWVPLIEREVESFLGHELSYATGVVDWPVVSGENYVLLRRTPVTEVTEVRLDRAGGFGQIPDTFGTDTILTPGVDYYLDLDGVGVDAGKSGTGTLWRTDGTPWGSGLEYSRDLLRNRPTPARGFLKVTYNGGWTSDHVPAVVIAAIAQAAGVWYATLTNVGVVSSENVPGYSYSQILGFNLGDNIFSNVRDMLRTYKRYSPGGGDR